MTILPSNISVEFVKKYLRIEHDLDDIELHIYLESAKSYIQNYTSMTIEELDNHKEVIICVLMLCSHFYENKSLIVDKNTEDSIFNNILSLHRGWL